MTDTRRHDLGILTFGSPRAASVRYRVLQYLPFLAQAGVRTTLLVPPGTAGDAPRDFPVCWIQKKLLSTLKVRALARRHTLVFDFDDAIWTSEKGDRSFLTRWRTEARLRCVLRKSALVLAGNDFLAAHARRYASNVLVVPTVLEAARYPQKTHGASDLLTLGWIGHSVNFKYLAALGPALQRVAAERPIRLLVVADRDFTLDGVDVVNRRWSEETEVADILAMDVGLMPLADDAWTRGKCGFKAIQYMAAGIPAIASAVGMNRQLIGHGVDGFLCTADDEWIAAVRQLQADTTLRADMGRRAREKVQAHYSLEHWGPVLAGLFKDLGRTRQ